MSQMRLTPEASDTLRNVSADIDGALKYIEGDAIAKDHVNQWAADLKTVLKGQVERAPRTPRAVKDA